MTKTPLPKYAKILEELRLEITSGKLTPGEYLPSQNELTSRYGVATGTVRQAISKLTADGWVKPQKGRGVFVQSPDQRRSHHAAGASKSLKSRQVGFVMFGNYTQFDPEAQMVLHGAMSVFEKAHRHVQYRLFQNDDHLEQNLSSFLDDISAMIITRDVTKRAADIIASSGVRAVLLDYRPYDREVEHRFSRVFCSADVSGYMAAQMLATYGHRRIGIFTNKPEEYEYISITISGIRRACQEHSLAEPVVFFAPDQAGEAKAIETISNSPQLTGIVSINDHPACRLIHGLRELGAGVPEAKSIVSIGGLSHDQLSEPALARVNRNYLELGATTAAMAIAESDGVVCKSLGAKFEPGRTLAWPSHAKP